jgi:hypothetical protein
VPINPAEVHNFDPNNVPTIHKLIEELDRMMVEDGAEHHSGMLAVSLRDIHHQMAGAHDLSQTGNKQVYDHTFNCWISTYKASCGRFGPQIV